MVTEEEWNKACNFSLRMVIQSLVLALISAILVCETISFFNDLNMASGLVLLFFLYKGFRKSLRWVHEEDYKKYTKIIEEFMQENGFGE